MSKKRNHVPKSLDFERFLLGHILNFPSFLETALPLVAAGDFYAQAHQWIYQAMQDAFLRFAIQAEVEPDEFFQVFCIELLSCCQFDDVGGHAYLQDLIGLTEQTTFTARELCRQIRNLSGLRQLIVVGTSLIRAAYTPGTSPKELAESTKAELAELLACLPRSASGEVG